MDRKDTLPIGDVLRLAIDECCLSGRLDECRAIEAWSLVVGPDLARQCGRPTMANGSMRVRIPAAALRNELQMSRRGLINAINAQLGKTVVTALNFTG